MNMFNYPNLVVSNLIKFNFTASDYRVNFDDNDGPLLYRKCLCT